MYSHYLVKVKTTQKQITNKNKHRSRNARVIDDVRIHCYDVKLRGYIGSGRKRREWLIIAERLWRSPGRKITYCMLSWRCIRTPIRSDWNILKMLRLTADFFAWSDRQSSKPNISSCCTTEYVAPRLHIVNIDRIRKLSTVMAASPRQSRINLTSRKRV